MKTKTAGPPRFLEALLGRIANRGRGAEILGDLEEEFRETAEAKGRLRAYFHYGRLVLVSLPSFLLDHLSWSRIMIVNDFKTSFRGLRRHAGITLINLAGLALGIGACLVIMLYVRFEMSYDEYHPDGGRIYRIAVAGTTSRGEYSGARITDAMAAAAQAAFPDIETAGRVEPIEAKTVKFGNVFSTEDRIAYADQSIFGLFAFHFLAGDRHRALSRPRTVVISERIARKYFGQIEPLGKLLTIDNRELEVAGVIADPPENTHLKVAILWTIVDRDADTLHRGWSPGRGPCFTYVRVRPGADLPNLEAGINALAAENNAERRKTYGMTERYFLQPLRSIHLGSRLGGEAEPAADPRYLAVFSVVGFLVLLVACVNFMNLATARYTIRAREVGIRKVVGARRKQLIRQFLGETFALSILAAAAAMSPLPALLPLLNRSLGTALVPSALFDPPILAGLAGVVFFVGLAAGTYPAFFLSSFRPASVFRSPWQGRVSGTAVRRTLAIGQFAVAIALIIGTWVMIRQVDFMKHKNLGFAGDQKLIVKLPTELSRKMIARQESKVRDIEIAKAEFRKYPFVSGVASSSSLPGRNISSSQIWKPGQKTNALTFSTMKVDADFFDVYDIPLVACLAPSLKIAAGWENDLRFGFLINERAARILGFSSPSEALGQEFFENRAWVAGVVRDFHYEGLRNEIGPLIIFLGPGLQFLTLSLNTDRLAESLNDVERAHRRLFPGEIFEYFFLDDDFNRQYKFEERAGRLAGAFAGLGIAIAGLGLFGLASFTITRRTKEIGIRKVLGATVSEIIVLLTREFAKWVAAANAIAWPVAFWAMKRWLGDFAYRTSLGWEIFVLSAGLAMAIALATISVQSVRAALANPADILRTE